MDVDVPAAHTRSSKLSETPNPSPRYPVTGFYTVRKLGGHFPYGERRWMATSNLWVYRLVQKVRFRPLQGHRGAEPTVGGRPKFREMIPKKILEN